VWFKAGALDVAKKFSATASAGGSAGAGSSGGKAGDVKITIVDEFKAGSESTAGSVKLLSGGGAVGGIYAGADGGKGGNVTLDANSFEVFGEFIATAEKGGMAGTSVNAGSGGAGGDVIIECVAKFEAG
jgi:hypothetical protein